MPTGPLRQAVGIPTSALAKDFVLPGSAGGTMPKLIYGTAWKEARTADLVYLAIKTGFRGIDTAAQPRHYREDLVGEGIRRAISEGLVTRKELYIQTKFTPIPGQDIDRMPYSAADPIPEQIHASITSSLRNLATRGPSASRDATAAADKSQEDEAGAEEEEEPYLDALLLHAPFPDKADTLTAWKALAAYVPHPVRRLGISNAPPRLVAALMDDAISADPVRRPVIVQNRFFDVGRFAPLRKGPHQPAGPDSYSDTASSSSSAVIFQSFHTLSLPALTHQHPAVQVVARSAGVEPHAALYALVLGLGGTAVLDGTRDAAHMRADLEGVEAVGRWAEAADGPGRAAWARCVEEFRGTVREEEP